MEVPPKERKIFKSSNLRGLREFISGKPLLKKARTAFCNTILEIIALFMNNPGLK